MWLTTGLQFVIGNFIRKNQFSLRFLRVSHILSSFFFALSGHQRSAIVSIRTIRSGTRVASRGWSVLLPKRGRSTIRLKLIIFSLLDWFFLFHRRTAYKTYMIISLLLSFDIVFCLFLVLKTSIYIHVQLSPFHIFHFSIETTTTTDPPVRKFLRYLIMSCHDSYNCLIYIWIPQSQANVVYSF